MRRKVSLVGPATLSVSLPSKWAKANNVKKGDEVEVTEDDDNLIIGVRSNNKAEKVTLDVRGIPDVLYRVVGALYKAGYDEIELNYDSPQELAILQKELGRSCVGFELVEQTKSRVVIRSISKLEEDEFETILRRCFLSVLGMAGDSLEAIKNQDTELMQKVILSDDSVNRYSDICRRIINKKMKVSGRSAPVYFITEQLEKIGDMYRDLMKFMIIKPFKLSKENLGLYQEVNLFLRAYYEIYYDFNLKRMNDFVIQKKRIQKLAEKCFECSSQKEILVLFHLNNIFSTTFDLNGALLTARV